MGLTTQGWILNRFNQSFKDLVLVKLIIKLSTGTECCFLSNKLSYVSNGEMLIRTENKVAGIISSGVGVKDFSL